MANETGADLSTPRVKAPDLTRGDAKLLNNVLCCASGENTGRVAWRLMRLAHVFGLMSVGAHAAAAEVYDDLLHKPFPLDVEG